MSVMPEIKASITTGRVPLNFGPSIWGHHFLSKSYNQTPVDNYEKALEGMENEVRKILVGAQTKYNDKPLEVLELIDTVERLGLSNYFKVEIEEILQMVYDQHSSKQTYHEYDLDHAALVFRLLRQHGYAISSDLFLKFKNGKTNMFTDSLTNNPKGLLNLYEASYFCLHGETILDDAQAFSATHLKSILNENVIVERGLANKIKHALNRPILKEPACLSARHFIDMYKQDATHNESLLNFARMGFHALQELYQSELRSLTMWWKDAECANKFPFTRDRVVEFFFWGLGIYWEPEYSFARCCIAKLGCIIAIIDDTFDEYGTPEEVELFTEAILRWDMNQIDELPQEYLIEVCKVTFNFFIELEELVTKEGRPSYVQYAIDEMKRAVRAFLMEYKMCIEKRTPTLDEYLSIGLITIFQGLVAAVGFAAMGDSYITENVYQWISSLPKVVMAVNYVGRIMNDMASHQVEEKSTSVECYMREHGVTIEAARVALREIVTSSWKDINQACCHPGGIPKLLMHRLANQAQIMDVLYKDGDTIRYPEELKRTIKFVVMDSVWDD